MVISHSIFDYPELCHVLAPHLVHRDLAACVLVNKSLHAIFVPYLYRTITLWDYRDYLPPAETVDIKVGQSPSLTSLLRYSQHVHSLTLRLHDRLQYTQNRYLSYISDHNTNSTEKKFEGQVQADTFVDIFHRCSFSNLYSLEIQGVDPVFPYRPIRGECGQAHFARERMIADQEQRDNTIARILCEVAALGTTSGPLYPGDANDMIHEHCKGDGAMSCGESHLSNGGLGGQKKRQRGVQHLKIVNSSGFSQQSLAMIFKTSLAQTIHHLDIQACSYVESDELHLLLETLPNLKFLDVRCRDQTGDLTPYSGLHLKKLPDEDALSGIEGDSSFSNAQLPSRLPLWSSHSSLEILRIGISNFTGMPIRVVENYDYERWITSAMLYHLKTHPLYNQPYPDSLLWVFDQLASLTQLKELCLVSAEAIFCKSQSLELTLKTGLAKLYTLKALECLDVEELNHAIGLEDVQWMVQHWPCLKQIRGLVRADQITLSEAALWLKANRPDIDLPVFKASN